MTKPLTIAVVRGFIVLVTNRLFFLLFLVCSQYVNTETMQPLIIVTMVLTINVIVATLKPWLLNL